MGALVPLRRPLTLHWIPLFMATKREIRQLCRIKTALIKAIGEAGHNVSSKLVFAALVDVTIDAGIVIAGKQHARDAICEAVNIRLLTSPARQVE
jgi:methylmalonyl-CoA mutase cobalamin-binding subunit